MLTFNRRDTHLMFTYFCSLTRPIKSEYKFIVECTLHGRYEMRFSEFLYEKFNGGNIPKRFLHSDKY